MQCQQFVCVSHYLSAMLFYFLYQQTFCGNAYHKPSIVKVTLFKFLSQIIKITVRYCKYTIDQKKERVIKHIQIQLKIILGVICSNHTSMLNIELMMYTSCVQGNAYCHCTLFHALILIVKLLLWKENMLNNVAVV